MALQFADDSLLNDDEFLKEAININPDIEYILPADTLRELTPLFVLK